MEKRPIINHYIPPPRPQVKKQQPFLFRSHLSGSCVDGICKQGTETSSGGMQECTGTFYGQGTRGQLATQFRVKCRVKKIGEWGGRRVCKFVLPTRYGFSKDTLLMQARQNVPVALLCMNETTTSHMLLMLWDFDVIKLPCSPLIYPCHCKNNYFLFHFLVKTFFPC